jgi:hypothetical protein
VGAPGSGGSGVRSDDRPRPGCRSSRVLHAAGANAGRGDRRIAQASSDLYRLPAQLPPEGSLRSRARRATHPSPGCRGASYLRAHRRCLPGGADARRARGVAQTAHTASGGDRPTALADRRLRLQRRALVPVRAGRRRYRSRPRRRPHLLLRRTRAARSAGDAPRDQRRPADADRAVAVQLRRCRSLPRGDRRIEEAQGGES